MSNGEHWIFQQDSAPAHKAKSTQQWLGTNVPDFIKANEWPSGSPDLNPLDYSLWAYLEEEMCFKRYHNLDQLKSALVRAMKEIPLEKVPAAIDQWPERFEILSTLRYIWMRNSCKGRRMKLRGVLQASCCLKKSDCCFPPMPVCFLEDSGRFYELLSPVLLLLSLTVLQLVSV
ncbi:hypothetical protein LAZ67_10001281 [Cordylochernes scorpioides]|uniref:Tc1-like transposase DDE domain-containing protein n=1 Tax=Cordylochernes scorpioides TaxID=51811 RepID=A0ABY6KYI7_9ARAC|nr:hypothetical protein LAZ67_10001281 [Cordylochernes scorpioides]